MKTVRVGEPDLADSLPGTGTRAPERALRRNGFSGARSLDRDSRRDPIPERWRTVRLRRTAPELTQALLSCRYVGSHGSAEPKRCPKPGSFSAGQIGPQPR